MTEWPPYIRQAYNAQQRNPQKHDVQLEIEDLMTIDFKVGDTVKAFHPGKFGVINHGTVVSRGSKYARIDFGELGGGIFKVLHKDITEVVNA